MRTEMLAVGALCLVLVPAAHGQGLYLSSRAAPEAAPPVTATDEEQDAAEKGGGVDIRWEDGKTRIDMDSAGLELSNRIQFGFVYEDPDDSVRLPGTSGPGEGKPSFKIRRAKTTLEGWFWKPELTFEVQLTWAGAEEGNSNARNIEDLYLNWDASKTEAFQIKFGQYKVPFGRQLLTTSIGLEFVDRSILAGEFTRGRDVGLQVWGRLADKKVDYYVGMFNGNNTGLNSNANTKFQYNARLMFQPFGNLRYSEGDFESTDKPLLAVAGQFESNDRTGTSLGIGGQAPTDFNDTILSGDVAFKYRGLFLFGEYFARNRAPREGQEFDSNGYNMQAGYFLKRNVLEVALRYAAYDPTALIDDNDVSEKGIALSYFIRGHRMKVQGDWRQIEDEGRSTKHREVRIQTYVQF